MAHSPISPAILYWGTPVVLITSESEDGPDNICAISSVFWLGHRCILGFGAENKTTQNILRTGHCVVNLPDDTMARNINLLATTTGTKDKDITPSKRSRNYRYVEDKWACADLTPQKSDLVRPARILECPVQMECELAKGHVLMEDFPDLKGVITAIELKVLRVHILDHLRMPGQPNRVNPDGLRPIFMCFQELYGFGDGKVAESVLGKVHEEKYRGITRSTVVKLPGDEDKEEVEEKMKQMEVKASNGY
jgi:flavin reductase (DIM6/NTAB) family NADH-FMN oxidoreductase RutF